MAKDNAKYVALSLVESLWEHADDDDEPAQVFETSPGRFAFSFEYADGKWYSVEVAPLVAVRSPSE
jgi:hypothetical protein